jgi:polyhydroxyalkanoate synthase
MDQTPFELNKMLEANLDPFGVLSAVQEVQKAWLGNPQALSEEVRRLAEGVLKLQEHSLRRFAGSDEADAFPPVPEDERFRDPIWTENPCLDTLKESYLLWTRWLEDAIFKTPGVEDKTRRKAAFWARQGLNATAPTNFLATNPAALFRAFETGGKSLADGVKNFLADSQRGTVSMVDESGFRVGENLATTPGAVVYRNELVEVIQYAPTTETVHEVPIVFVPPWINKYYILDLDAKKSLIRHMVGQGFTVFAISWRNPGPEMRDVTLDDYMLRGVLETVEAARETSGARQVHLCGYCIGGTVAAALMAWLNRQAKKKDALPVAHWSVLTTLVDFESPGDIDVFISEGAIAALEKRMAKDGYLDGQDMAAAFRMLRANSLIWHYWVRNYLHGETPAALDVLYWNMDTTRMPEAMHAYYLREFYLENRLAEKDGVTLGGRPIDLGRITQPLYAVGTEQDHIAPWKETFKICGLVKSPVRYVLATSGHILGIVNPPVDPPKRKYWAGDATGANDPEAWQAGIGKVPGTWWADWVEWLRPQCGPRKAPPGLGSEAHPVLAPAPGTYVLER